MEVFYINLAKIHNIETNISKKDLKKIQHETGRFIVDFVSKNFYNLKNNEVVLIENKPQFKHEFLKFNITHSNKISAVVFDKNEVSIDAEYMAERDFKKLEKRYKKNFKTKEKFYEFWTKYEAEIKLKKNVFDEKSFVFLNDYFMTIASEKKIEKINFYEIFKTENEEFKYSLT